MKTFEEQKAFFDRHWEAMRQALEEGGAPKAVAFVDGFEDGLERRVLHLFARQGVANGDWAGKNLDAVVEVARAGIGEMRKEAEASEEAARKAGLTNLANVISYNLAADLAHCWPEDDLPRTAAHFEAGLQAAEDCVRWREELGNGPGALSMAWWAKGMHELSLGRTDAARTSWEKSLAFAREDNDDAKSFPILLGRGYAGLGRLLQGDDGGLDAYQAALSDFRAQLEDEERKGDAQFGIDQLEVVRSRYGSAAEET